MGYHHINMKFFVAFSAVVAMVSAELTPICSDTEPDTDMDSVMLDLRALPVSMLLTCPCLVLPDTSTTERGRLRLSPTSDTDSDTPDTDTLELDSRALPVSTLPMFP